MKKHLISFALYGLPALLVLLAFMIGHATIEPEQDRLKDPVQAAKEIVAIETEDNQPDVDQGQEAADDDDPALVLGEPDFQYYPYPSTIIGNVPNSTKLFSFEIAVSIYDTPLAANVMISTLEEREPQLRPHILENAIDLDESILLSKSGRADLEEDIKETINTYLVRWGYDPFIHTVEITSFIIT